MKLRNLLYLVPLFLVGCDIVEFNPYDEIVPGTVKVSPTSVEYSYSGGNTELTVSSATPWTAEFINDADAEWVSVNPASGQAGDTKVTLIVKPFAPKDLTRENVIKFVGKDGSAAGVSFKQAWAEPKTEYKFNKVTQIVDGRSYLIVADGNAAYCELPKGYGYLPVSSVIDTDGSITLSNKAFAWTFTAVDGGYTIKGPDDIYIYQTGTYNSFNISDSRMDGDVWTVEFQEDGSAKIINVSVQKYIQYSTGYGTYGSYAIAQEDGVVPSLYEEEVDPNAASLIPSESVVSVDADATEAVFQIGSGGDWVVECDSDWITSYTTNGSGDGEVVITFGKNKNFDEERTAEFKIYGSGIEASVSVVQAALVPVFEVKESAVSVEAGAGLATINIESNLPWEVVCPAGIETLTPSGDESAEVTFIMAPNYTKSDIVYNVVVKTTSDRVETKEYTVVITHKTDIKIPVPFNYAFESDFGEFSVENVIMPESASYIWSADTKNKCLKASAYISGKNYASESWVVSPTLDLSTLPATKAVIEYAINYGTPAIYAEQMYFLVIDGENQTRINISSVPAKGSWTFYKEEVDLSAWAGKNIKFAMVYTSTDAAAATFEIKSISFEEKLDKVSDIFEKGEGIYSINAVVMAKSGSNVIVGDGTADIMLYKSGNDLAVGDVVAIRNGAVSSYNGLLQFNGADYTKIGTQTPNYGKPVVMKTDDDIINWKGEPQYQYFEFTGIMDSDNRTIKCGDYGIYIAKTTGFAGLNVKVRGYANGVASKYKTITTTLVSIEEVTETVGGTSMTLDQDAIKASHSESWTYTSGEKTITAADGSVWVANNTYANKDQVTIQMNKGKGSYVLTPSVAEGKTIKKLTVVCNSKNDGTGTDSVTRTFDIFDGDAAVLSDIKGDDLTAGVTITGTHRQLRIAPNEKNGGACYIVSATIEY